jgi:malonyl-CoA/methylmalonyl-CoA synthetase
MPVLPLLARAHAHGSKTALRCDQHVFCFSGLLTASRAVAAAMLDGRDDLAEAHIAFLVPPGEKYVHAQWGIWQAGGVAVPLSLAATAKELSYAIAASQSSVVLATHEHAASLQPIADAHSTRLLLLEGIPHDASSPLPEITPDRRGMMLYTSGTTSTPKGVVTTHGCIQAQVEALIDAWRWQAGDRIPLFLPLHHIHGIINVLCCGLWAGAEIDVLPRFDLSTVFDRVASHAYTIFMAVPTIYVKMIEALRALPAERASAVVAGFEAMRLMVSGSAALPTSVHEQWTALTGQRLLERYGMTEIGMALSNPYDGERRPGAVGQPLPGVDVCLRSEAGDWITTESVPGEIHVRGPNVFLEYWNQPEATRDAFRDGWFRTGDIAVMEDGFYRIMGRSSVDIIKSGGYKLSALEIEAALLDHPAITLCAVVGLPDDTWGETVAAAVVLATGASLDLESLQAWCHDCLSPYKMPRALLVCDDLPRNAMGKVTKPAVSALFAETSS